jgi:site-specific DNA recombinase
MRAIIYARFSSDNQREESIDAQLRAIYTYAAKNGIEIIDKYIDEARSATTTDNRDAFLRMIDDIQKGLVKVDLCLVHKYDRFARDNYDHVINERKLNNKNVRLLAVDQPVDDSPEGNLTKNTLVNLSAYFSQNLSRETKKGLKENALKALHCGGIPPLGYDVIPDGGNRHGGRESKKYIINENEAEIVRLIFKMKSTGSGYFEIINTLNQNKMKTKRDQPFGKNSIHDILVNEKYIGTFIYNKGSENNHRQTRNEVIKIVNAIPRIIDDETWHKVQRIMKTNIQTKPRRHGKMQYILTGKVQCGACGGSFTGNSRKGGINRKQYYYYACSGRRLNGQCKNIEIRKEILEGFVLNRIQMLFFSEDSEAWADKIEKLYNEQSGEVEGQEAEVKSKITQVNQKISNLYRAIEKGLDDDETIKRMHELKDEKKSLEYDLQYFDIRKNTRFTREQIIKFMEMNRKIIYDREKPAECHELVDRFIEKIIVYQDRIDLKLKFSLDVDKVVVPTCTVRLTTSILRKELYT